MRSIATSDDGQAWALRPSGVEAAPKRFAVQREPLDSAPRCLSLTRWLSLVRLPLDRTFAALADPTRRALLTRLAEQPDLSVSALAAPFAVSLPAIMKHLDVLVGRRTGRAHQIGPHRHLPAERRAPMQDAIDWLNRYERFWSEALSRLSDFLEEEESWPSTPPSNQASQSSAASKRPPPKSSRPGPTRKK